LPTGFSTGGIACAELCRKAINPQEFEPRKHHHPFFFSFLFIEKVGKPRRRMSDILITLYPWNKAIHIMAVISWMAGIFYLPRLFVYHVEQSQPGDSRDEVFQTMEYKLLRVIMNPAMIATWLFGLALVMTPGIVDWGAIWPYTKGAAILAMTWFHQWLGLRRKDFARGENSLTGRQFRMMNEVPTILMVIIVLSVVVRF